MKDRKKENMATKDFTGTGVCSAGVTFTVDEDGLVRDVSFAKGCEGNLKAVACLVEGRPTQEVIELLYGITCGKKRTSCSDQFARALAATVDGAGE